MSKNIKVCYIEYYIICISVLTLELENTAEKEHVTEDSTLQNVVVEQKKMKNEESEFKITYYVVFYTQLSQKERKH